MTNPDKAGEEPSGSPGCLFDRSVWGLPRVYRYFDKRANADALIHGRVWVSTLEKCRNHENPGSRDPMDGKRDYRPGLIAGDSDDPLNAVRLERSGWSGMHFSNSIVIRGPIRHEFPDAFVLCTTIRRDPDAMTGLGKFCVEIREPIDFCALLAEQVRRRFPAINLAKFKLVTYRKQSYEGGDEEPGEIAFTKDPDKYEKEQEARMLFVPQDGPPLRIGARQGSCRLIHAANGSMLT